MQIDKLVRSFRYNGVRLTDPNQDFSLNQVRDFYANVYPEITSADIEGPEQIGAEQVYTFRKAVGTKGADRLTSAQAQLADLAALAADGALTQLDAEIVAAMQQQLATTGHLSTVMTCALAGFHVEYCLTEVA